jgi:hypothetical protein
VLRLGIEMLGTKYKPKRLAQEFQNCLAEINPMP